MAGRDLLSSGVFFFDFCSMVVVVLVVLVVVVIVVVRLAVLSNKG